MTTDALRPWWARPRYGWVAISLFWAAITLMVARSSTPSHWQPLLALLSLACFCLAAVGVGLWAVCNKRYPRYLPPPVDWEEAEGADGMPGMPDIEYRRYIEPLTNSGQLCIMLVVGARALAGCHDGGRES